eukprot:GHVT01032327.1.p2 GENE.GHVT01032327.1~~GHVT01032327.1.p2  ORF type:complete len:123 (-),score=5.66 GHVT01032327.1:956-1324(-)
MKYFRAWHYFPSLIAADLQRRVQSASRYQAGPANRSRQPTILIVSVQCFLLCLFSGLTHGERKSTSWLQREMETNNRRTKLLKRLQLVPGVFLAVTTATFLSVALKDIQAARSTDPRNALKK